MNASWEKAAETKQSAEEATGAEDTKNAVQKHPGQENLDRLHLEEKDRNDAEGRQNVTWQQFNKIQA